MLLHLTGSRQVLAMLTFTPTRNIFTWYEDPKNHDYVESIDKKAQQIGRAGDKEDEFVSYTNTCRDGPIEWRYNGQDRIARLKVLKKQWDPTGVFTKELI